MPRQPVFLRHQIDMPNPLLMHERNIDPFRGPLIAEAAFFLDTFRLEITVIVAAPDLFLAIGYSIPVIAEVIRWFEECIIRIYANPLAEQQILLSDDDISKKQFLTMMNDMGIGITGYRFDQQSNEFYLQRTLHDTLYELPFSSESDGTRKLFAALPVILMALKEGRLVIVDELDAKNQI